MVMMMMKMISGTVTKIQDDICWVSCIVISFLLDDVYVGFQMIK